MLSPGCFLKKDIEFKEVSYEVSAAGRGLLRQVDGRDSALLFTIGYGLLKDGGLLSPRSSSLITIYPQAKRSSSQALLLQVDQRGVDPAVRFHFEHFAGKRQALRPEVNAVDLAIEISVGILSEHLDNH